MQYQNILALLDSSAPEDALLRLTLLAFALGTAVAFFFFLRLCFLHSDLQKLEQALRRLIRREAAVPKVQFFSPAVRGLWRKLLLMLGGAERSESNERAAQVVSLGSRIMENGDEEHSAAREVCQVLLQETRPEVLGVAVVLRDRQSAALRLEAIEGLPQKRLETAVLISVETLLDHRNWGYQLPAAGSAFDFTSFGINLSLLLPLRDAQGICGAIWLGFAQRASSLSVQRKAFVQAICEHAAASFYAAKKAREREARKTNERDFLLGMSHDLRAPGNSALYAVRELLSGEVGQLSTEQHLRLSIAAQAIEEQLEMLGDVLDYTKHQHGFLEAKKERIAVRALIEQLLSSFQLAAAKRGLELQRGTLPDLYVVGDSRHLKRILANFISNALKYTDQGTVKVEVQEKPGAAELRVIDSGIGVPEGEREQLFCEFRRLQNASSRQGVGLGLALSKALAELNGGLLRYQPNPSGGSIFSISLALAKAEAGEQHCAFGTILVVDDEAAVCRTNIRFLRDSARRLIPASSAEEALELARDFPPDLIVSDYCLGAKKASELLHELQADERKIPALIITGSSASPELEQLKQNFKVCVLEKPVDRTMMTQAIAELIN